ncbi:hypothetical protein [Synechococcus phage S-B68]|nr:hypothetical protein [Synechococcus phage S-B68]
MPNKHQDHPEDLILGGETWVLDAMWSEAHTSLKIDGAPAVVWGIHPETGKFFVGTKSVFNKRLIKVCYSEDDARTIYHKQPFLADVLVACYKHLPRREGVYQGDFIGFGGNQRYTPNTLTYDFGEIVTEDIIMAPHTQYCIPDAMYNAEAQPLQEDFIDTPHCKFVQPIVDRLPLQGRAPRVCGAVPFLEGKRLAEVKQGINALVREGKELTDDALYSVIGDHLLVHLYQMVLDLKAQLIDSFIIYNAPKCILDDQEIKGEGFVFYGDGGSFKVVDRAQFSYANFTKGRFQA